ncbi:isochorismate-pyruvate lyase [Pseudomonas sp. NCCP-436]|nr:isochorismate lyase [Pseudomonas sp. NCCP-436]GIZ12525.1 isochorismate-pyruvate lyase [Pseudomonas sp. NCCP-436]
MSTIKAPQDCSSLEDIRAAIDLYDRQIFDAMCQRLNYVRAAARFKPDEQSIPAPQRVAAMLAERSRWAAEAGFDEGFTRSLFEQLIAWNIEQQIQHWRHQRQQAAG